MSFYNQVKRINEAEYVINRIVYNEYKKYLTIDVTTQQAVLLEIVKTTSKVTVGDVAYEMKISSSAVSQLIAAMEKKELIVREKNPSNRREVFLLLGRRGLKYFEQHEYVEKMVANRLFSKLCKEELNQLESITKKLKSIALEEF